MRVDPQGKKRGPFACSALFLYFLSLNLGQIFQNAIQFVPLKNHAKTSRTWNTFACWKWDIISVSPMMCIFPKHVSDMSLLPRLPAAWFLKEGISLVETIGFDFCETNRQKCTVVSNCMSIQISECCLIYWDSLGIGNMTLEL